MLRIILGVIVGYVAFSISLFLLFSGLYIALGTAGSFQEGSFDLSWAWIIGSFIIFFLGGIVAAAVCGLIAKHPKSAFYMGATLFVIGILMAFMQIAQDPGVTVRELADVPLMDAMNGARGPAWSYFISPITGFLGAMVGGTFVKSE